MFSAPRLVAVGVMFALISTAILAGSVRPRTVDPVTPPATISESPTPLASQAPTPSATPTAGTLDARRPLTRTLFELPQDSDPTELVRSQDGRTFYVDRADGTVMMVDLDGYAIEAGHEGDVTGQAVTAPRLLATGDRDLQIVDAEGGVWYWRQLTEGGNLVREGLIDNRGEPQGEAVIGPTTMSVTGFTRALDDYDLYALDPTAGQVVRYRRHLDAGFLPPDEMLDEPSADLASARDLYADPDLYVLTDGGVRRYRSGRLDDGFDLEALPGATDLRFIDGVGSNEDGRLYIYDAASGRLLEFAKEDGRLINEWGSGPDQPPMQDVRGIQAHAGGKDGPARVTWMTPDGLFESVLSVDPADAPKPVGVLGSSPVDGTEGTRKPIRWRSSGARFEADALSIKANGQVFKGAKSAKSDYYAGIDNAELEFEWQEKGRPQYMNVYLEADSSHWWVNEIWTRHGNDGDWIKYQRLAPLTRTPQGEALETDLRLTADNPDREESKKGARLRIDGLRLTAFEPGTAAAPLSGCQPLSPDAGVAVETNGFERIDYFAEGATMQGLDRMSPAEASERLTELGICHEFRYSYRFPKKVPGGGDGFSERWCTLPMPVRPRQYDSLDISILPNGHAVIFVGDEKPRKRREQPPAGWNCPTN